MFEKFDDLMRDFGVNEAMEQRIMTNRPWDENFMTKTAPAPLPPIDILVGKNYINIQVALPGFTLSEITVDVKGSALSIHAKRFSASGHDGMIHKKSQIIRDDVDLTWGIDPKLHNVDAVEAKLGLGILSVIIPLKKVETPKSTDRAIVVGKYE